jgi:hypothetical protein
MIVHRRALSLVLLASTLLPLAGCLGAAASVATHALKEVRGAHADVLPATDVGRQTLSKYQGIEFTPAMTTAGRLCPPSLLRAYDRATSQIGTQLQSAFPGGAPTLTIDSDILYFQGKGMLSGAFMLTRVKLRDGQRVTGELFVRAESESFHAGGEDALANASVTALGKYLKARGAVRAGGTE